MLFFGLSMSASVRISNSLGAGCPVAARRLTAACLCLILLTLAGAISMLMILRVR